ncbi:hypothetical protein E2C01_094243 [Portunus trituberculatus]|uniref:Uncharacterized protein n=1 Tax=Portunus trituberculatus TaxID=210409 RepID=A0A5B7K137_PORTR|nr:hypothetical protein [Portunus trituberculatus]
MVTSCVVVCNWIWLTNDPFGSLTSNNSLLAVDGWPVVEVEEVVVVVEVEEGEHYWGQASYVTLLPQRLFISVDMFSCNIYLRTGLRFQSFILS